jgi:two-component system, LytTR family, response regulator
MKIEIGSRTKVLPSDVVCFISDSNYTTVYFQNGKKKLLSTHLKKIEKRFAEINYFFRPNRSFFVNLNFTEFSTENFQLKVNNEYCLSVSRRRKQKLLDIIQQNEI